MASLIGYLWTCLWLWAPPMALSFAMAGRLPPAYQPDMFGEGIPAWLDSAEHVSRLALIALSAFMVLQFDGQRQRLGLAIYVIGLACYAASYWAQIAAPDSGWSRSVLGFAAPAYTTALWIAGIGLIGERWFLPQSDWLGWAFLVLAAAFVVTHTSHAALIHHRFY